MVRSRLYRLVAWFTGFGRLTSLDVAWLEATLPKVFVAFTAGVLAGHLLDWPALLRPTWLMPLALAALLALAIHAWNNRQIRQRLAALLVTAVAAGFLNVQAARDTSDPRHVTHLVAEKGYREAMRVVVGAVDSEPEVREHYTLLSVVPDWVSVPGAQPVQISGGKILVRLYPSAKSLYGSVDYGSVLRLEAPLRRPAAANNPGLFDARRFYLNQGYYGEMRIRRDREARLLDEVRGGLLMRSALAIKDRMLGIVKRSVPFPQSAFVGGVLLGMRHGLDRSVHDQFRAAGVYHVLAVSGLHVMIIAMLFVGLFDLMRVPKRLSAVTISTFLVLFLLLTGARPATQRATIMAVVGVCWYYFFGGGLRTSAVTGLWTAAFVILLRNPLLLFEPAFLFSCAAVLSLIHLTGPVDRLLRRWLTSPTRMGIFVLAAVWLSARIARTDAFTNPPQAVYVIAASLPLLWLLGWRFPGRLRFDTLPVWLRIFLSAQMAINIAMNPLAAYFFLAVPLASPLANLFALPLIGIVVQIGLLMGLCGLIPEAFAQVSPALGRWVDAALALPFNALLAPVISTGLRPPIESVATVFGAAVYPFVVGFLEMARFFHALIPYPAVPRPSIAFLVVYLAGLILFANDTRLGPWVSLWAERFRVLSQDRSIAIRLRLAAVLTGLALVALVVGLAPWRGAPLQVTVIDPSIFGMGSGEAIWIRTPRGGNILIDGGPAEVRTSRGVLDIDVGERTVLPLLLSQGVGRLDLVIASSLAPDHVGGLAAVMRVLPVERVVDAWGEALPVDPPRTGGLSRTDAKPAFSAFLWALGDSALIDRRDSETTRSIFRAYRRYRRQLARLGLEPEAAHGGVNLWTETVENRTLRLDVVSPPEQHFTGPFSTDQNALVLRLTYGDFSMLMPSTIGKRAESWILDNVPHMAPADVLIVPAHGRSWGSSDRFIDAVGPQLAIASYRYEKLTNREVNRTLQRYRTRGIEALRIDETGAIRIWSRGLEDPSTGRSFRCRATLSGAETEVCR